jgi:hypothetical protein
MSGGRRAAPTSIVGGRQASAPSGRVRTTATAGESGRKPGPGRPLLIVLSVAERTPPPPGRPSHARPVRGRRAAHAGRHAIGLLDIGARGRRHGRPQPAAGASSSPARRPDRLALLHGLLPESPGGPIDRATCAPRGRVRGSLALWAAAATPRSRFSAAGRGSSAPPRPRRQARRRWPRRAGHP